MKAENDRNIESYKLPEIDTQKERRNFPGCEEKVYWTTEELQEGDTRGMTETDKHTSGKDDGPYTRLQEKSGDIRMFGKKLGFEPKYFKTKVDRR